MRLSKNVQVLLFSSIAAAATALTFSRNRIQTNPEKLLQKTVDTAVNKWKKKLYLTPDQTKLFRKTLHDFAIQKNKIMQLKLNQKGKTERLQEFQLLENEEMRQILTDSQYESYLNLISEKATNK